MSDHYDGTALELVPGTLRGYRAWYVPSVFSFGKNDDFSFGKNDDDFFTLKSLSMNFFWRPGPPERATCHGRALLFDSPLSREVHPSPVRGCSCGYYATYRLHHLPVFREWVLTGDVYVVGTVTAHGKIVLGTKGFRAEYMTIEALSLDHPTYSWLAQAYDAVAVHSFDELTSKYPPSNVDELLGVSRSGNL